MPVKDYYEILRLGPDADEEALKRAFRTLARLHHPDHNPDDEAAAATFRAVHEAYTVLSHPQFRQDYDRRRSEMLLGTAAGARDGEPVADHPTKATPRSEGERQNDAHTSVTVTFDQALRGGHTHVQGPDGELVRVTIPRGCRDETTVRVRDKGPLLSESGHRGDLLVTFRVQPHQRFRRERNHLHVIETITAVEAMVGTTRSLTDAYGRTIHLTIPAGIQPGARLRLQGQGVIGCGEPGDLFVEIDVQVPKELSDEQRNQLRRAAEQMGLL